MQEPVYTEGSYSLSAKSSVWLTSVSPEFFNTIIHHFISFSIEKDNKEFNYYFNVLFKYIIHLFRRLVRD